MAGSLGQTRKRSTNPNFLVWISSGGVGVFHVNGWGPKSSVCLSKPREPKLLGRISRAFLPGYHRCARKRGVEFKGGGGQPSWAVLTASVALESTLTSSCFGDFFSGWHCKREYREFMRILTTFLGKNPQKSIIISTNGRNTRIMMDFCGIFQGKSSEFG